MGKGDRKTNVSPPWLECTVRQADKPIGYLVIDSLSDGRAHGGIRLQQDIGPADVRMLAHTMTQKNRFLGLPFGGAKAAVIGDPEAPLETRRRLFGAFGHGIRPLLAKGVFVPAADMGTDVDDIRSMLDRIELHLEKRRIPRVDSALFTAHSILGSARALADQVGLSLLGAKVAIEGFGKVGSALAQLLVDAGCRVVAISTLERACYDPQGLDVTELLHPGEELKKGVGVSLRGCAQVAKDALIGLPVDILFPCATYHTIDETNVGAIQAHLVCPGANNPWPESVERMMDAKGIAYLPDFAVNSGGILGTTMTYAGLPLGEVEDAVGAAFFRSTRWVLERAASDGVPVRQAAEELADRRSANLAKGAHLPLGTFFIQTGLWFHRRGLAPLPLVCILARRYFDRLTKLGLS